MPQRRELDVFVNILRTRLDHQIGKRGAETLREATVRALVEILVTVYVLKTRQS